MVCSLRAIIEASKTKTTEARLIQSKKHNDLGLQRNVKLLSQVYRNTWACSHANLVRKKYRAVNYELYIYICTGALSYKFRFRVH